MNKTGQRPLTVVVPQRVARRRCLFIQSISETADRQLRCRHLNVSQAFNQVLSHYPMKACIRANVMTRTPVQLCLAKPLAQCTELSTGCVRTAPVQCSATRVYRLSRLTGCRHLPASAARLKQHGTSCFFVLIHSLSGLYAHDAPKFKPSR
jgi:hypothetical protein